MAYVTQGEFDGQSLWQGDVIRDVHLLGAICYRDLSSPTNSMGEQMNHWTVSKKLEAGTVAVLSHSCEVAKENGVKLTSIVVAPLRDVSSATEQSKISELIESNRLGDGGFSYLKYFYLPSSPAMNFPRGAVIDFSKLFSIRKSSYDFLLSRKILQLDEETRQSMAIKLAVYFYREREAA